MGLLDELQADMLAAVADYETTMEWRGLTVPCVRASNPTDIEFLDGGAIPGLGSLSSPGIDFSMVVSKTAPAFVSEGELPKIGELINSGANQIKKVQGADDPNAPAIIVFAGSPDR